MQTETISLMEIFFINTCGTDGSIPNCRWCEYNIKNVGCDHPEHPFNRMMGEVQI